MKKILPFLFILLAQNTFSQKYIPSDSDSKVHFNIRNFGIKTGGQLTGLKGVIYFFTTDLASSHFDVSVDPSTIDTDSDSRDKSLRGNEYFDVAKFPAITLTSTKIEKTNKTDQGYYYFTGDLNLHGITKQISFPFHVEKVNNDYLFTGEFEINRLDYGVGEESAVLSNTVDVTLSVLAKKV
ncbi:MAG: YceI family protein [Bacteroidota bacterium]|nr:YceI family protein [Bacteroidota bacterium]